MTWLLVVSDAATTARYPELGQVVLLRDAGWKFHHHTVAGELVAVDAYKLWPGGWRDAISVRTSTEAVAVRIRLADAGAPPEIVWERTGTLAEVVDELLVLPMPGVRTAPRLAIGYAPDSC